MQLRIGNTKLTAVLLPNRPLIRRAETRVTLTAGLALRRTHSRQRTSCSALIQLILIRVLLNIQYWREAMTSDQLEALNASIAHWEENVILEDEEGIDSVDQTSGSCECCRRFKNDLDNDLTWSEEKVCSGCPIYQYTKMPFCRGTPYGFLTSVNEGHPNATLHSWHMVNWLKDLRDGKQPKIYPHINDDYEEE